ncbi:MAG TPA: SsgA family sporulation/cell division regulator [Jiangellaceae bacterium]|nr:SsgA family sporulation/cell division regulator [Jiangellaceae bacterium]
MDRTTVSYDLALHLLSADGHVLPLTAILHYDARDPLAVTALFNDGSGEPIRWVFARDLLEAGLDQAAGEGDVLIWPTRDVEGRPAIHLRLRSPHGDALLEACADELERFLLATHRLVPPGSEHRHLDLEAAITALLADT